MRPLLIPAIGLSSGEHISDARLFVVALLALAGCILWQGIVAWRHRRTLRAIPVRIHVAGTRGKSTTTRLIAAALRASGRRVVAKTTGSEPRLILPDGRDEVLASPRTGIDPRADRLRQTRRAARRRHDRRRMHGDPSGVRVRQRAPSDRGHHDCHHQYAGRSSRGHRREREASAQALAWSICANGQLVVSAEAASPALLARAKARGTAVTIVDTAGLDPIEADRALALAVATAHGVPAAIAKPAMEAAAPDPGSFRERTLDIEGKPIRFANAFACNDVDSLKLLWPTVATSERPVVLLNARRDRPLRTQRFLAFLAAQVPMPLLFIVGDPLAARLARRAGFGPDAVQQLRARLPDSALRELAAFAPSGGVIWGVGNYQGFGARLTAELAGRDASC